MNHLPTLAAVVLTLVLPPTTAAPPMYRAIDIGKLPEARYIMPYGLNNSGTVVGNAQYARGISAFSWTRTDGISKLPVPPGGEAESYAHDINDAGRIIGRVISGGPLGTGGEVIWEVDGSFNFYLGDSWAATARPYSIPQITGAGRVLGQSYWGDDSNIDIFPWVWSPQRGLVDIVALGDDRYKVYQMNDSGRIVGYRASCDPIFGVASAFVYDAPTQRMRWLDPDHDKFCRQSNATAVNDHGDVVGWVETYDRGRTVAMIWTEADGWQTLSDSLAPNRATIWATDINNARQVVGGLQLMNQTWRLSFFYWDKDNGLYDLKKLLDPDDPMTAEVILYASNSTPDSPYIPKINDRGEILVSGSLRGDKDIFLQPQRAFLLVPVQKQQ
jgi:hypothetical protein